MKKILLSVAVIGIAGVLAVNATSALFTDVERSTGNTFTAGEIDLKIDNT
ncbi:MAG: SipW-dependent-type signal peptide-containing protein, partial [Candidatus Pacebacteria bacterium]|nr:SipW-dependent-type signal peptide-containing protein [Candidatus Paceibacterota bacterium]